MSDSRCFFCDDTATLRKSQDRQKSADLQAEAVQLEYKQLNLVLPIFGTLLNYFLFGALLWRI